MSEAQNGGNVMERLTYWNEEYGCWSYHCGSGEAANHLAAYEETGRTPEEVTALGKLFDYALEKSKTLTEQLALLNRIRDLAEADKDGRLVVLPCKTRQQELLEQYPTADVDESGVLEVCPALLFASHRGKKGGCSTPNRSCDDCRKEFWSLWAEAALEAKKDE